MLFNILQKILIYFFLNLNFQNLDVADEDLELDGKPADYPYRIKQKNQANPEDEEEFDNPELLRAKQQQQQYNNGIPKGIPANAKQFPNQVDPNMANQMYKKEDLHNQSFEQSTFRFSLYEYLMSGFVVLFLINWFWGKSQNESLAMKWFNANKSFFTYNYAHIGHENNYSQFNMNSPFL